MDISIIGKPTFIKSKKLILNPFFFNIPKTITLADAPTIVPFPPRQAPSDKDHQRGSILALLIEAISFISGIIVATNGILSKNEDAIADNQSITIFANDRLPFVVYLF